MQILVTQQVTAEGQSNIWTSLPFSHRVTMCYKKAENFESNEPKMIIKNQLMISLSGKSNVYSWIDIKMQIFKPDCPVVPGTWWLAIKYWRVWWFHMILIIIIFMITRCWIVITNNFQSFFHSCRNIFRFNQGLKRSKIINVRYILSTYIPSIISSL